MKNAKFRIATVISALVVVLLLICLPAQAAQTDIPTFDSPEEAAVFLRDGIVNRSFERDTQTSVKVTIRLSDKCVEQCENGMVSVYEIIQQIVWEHTGNPKGGDYLEKNGGLIFNYTYLDGYYVIETGYHYAFSHLEAEKLDAAVNRLLTELDLSGCTDYEKIRAIYDWISLNIEYDYSYTNFTAYDALCKRKATCQGYGSLFYRLCLELGIDCRYCGGLVNNGYGMIDSHGWNIVQLEGKWYYVDTTWGAGLINGEPDYYYFLKGVDGMTDHLIVPARWEGEIGDYCIVTEEDYPIPEKQMIVASGYITDTIYYELSKARVLTITGTGALEDQCFDTGMAAEVIIGEGITSIGTDVFSTTEMASISLPDSLITLETDSLGGVMNLHLPKNLKNIAPGALNAQIDTLTIDPENPYYNVENGCLFTEDMKILVSYAGIYDVEKNMLITEYHVPTGVETIGAKAFYRNAMIEKIVLPDTVKYVEESAFAACTKANFTLTDSIISIADGAFADCTAMESVYIGKNVKSIGDCVFIGASMQTITVHPQNQHYVCVDGVLFNRDMTELIRYPVGRTNNTYQIPEGIQRIGGGAFATFESVLYHGANLEYVYFPDSLRSIGKSAFLWQQNMRLIKLPQNLEIIEEYAFVNIGKMDKIEIPDSVQEIGYAAFEGNNADIIILGSNLKTIGYKAFIRRDYVEGTSASVCVYANGGLPNVIYNSDYDAIFGYSQYDAANNGTLVTIYYPYEYRASWAPNGESYWEPEPKTRFNWNRYKLVMYKKVKDCFCEVVVTEPTCTTYGYTTYICTLCGKSYMDEKKSPAAHTYDDNVDGTCNGCGVNRETVETREVVHMFRMYNPNTGEHFYTGSTVERDNLIVAGWHYEGIGFTFPANTGDPVHRLFQPSTGEHLYTMDVAEKDRLMAEGWNYEGIAFNSAYDTEAVQHRLHNPNATVGAYHFTFSEEEKQTLIDAGWEYQGIGWYSCWK